MVFNLAPKMKWKCLRGHKYRAKIDGLFGQTSRRRNEWRQKDDSSSSSEGHIPTIVKLNWWLIALICGRVALWPLTIIVVRQAASCFILQAYLLTSYCFENTSFLLTIMMVRRTDKRTHTTNFVAIFKWAICLRAVFTNVFGLKFIAQFVDVCFA